MHSRGRPQMLTGARRYPNRLRELRQNCRLSQHDVAAAAGISGAYYGALERGDKRINADTARRLATPLRCSAGDLLGSAQSVSVPLTFAVAAAEAAARPAEFDLPEPHERLQPGRLADSGNCFAAEIFDDSADIDFAPGSVLFARPPGAVPIGAKVIVRFFLEPTGTDTGRTTHEILYGILDRNIVGDLVLITRTRNRLIPRNVLVKSAPPRSDFAVRALSDAQREVPIAYQFAADDPAELLGVVIYAMGPV